MQSSGLVTEQALGKNSSQKATKDSRNAQLFIVKQFSEKSECRKTERQTQ